MNLVEFSENEKEFQAWLAQNPDGFVINTRRNRPPSYMVLHRATCSKIWEYNRMARPGGFTERNHIKICSSTKRNLSDWVKLNGRSDGSFSKRCSFCKP